MLVQFTIMWILIVVTLFLLIYAISYQYRYSLMTSYPIPQCYNDYLCKQVVNGQVVEVNMADTVLFNKNSVQQICTPLTSDNICGFTYVNQDGETVTEKPGTYVNTWADVSGCSASNNYIGCPLYTIGDIYWRACYNGYSGSQYNDYNRTYFNENTNSSICG